MKSPASGVKAVRSALMTVWDPLLLPNECASSIGAKSGGTASSRPDGNGRTFFILQENKGDIS